jgi:hypothetical protein
MRDQEGTRFVVVISAQDRGRVEELAGRGFDLRVVRSDAAGYHADAKITLEQIGELVEAGYTVLVERTDRPKYEHKFIGFDEWYEGMLADLERQREKR